MDYWVTDRLYKTIGQFSLSVYQIRSLRTTLAFCPALREHVLSLLLTSKTKGNKLTTFLVQELKLKDYTKQKTAFIHKRRNGKMKVAKVKQLGCSCHYVYTCLLLHLNLHTYIQYVYIYSASCSLVYLPLSIISHQLSLLPLQNHS